MKEFLFSWRRKLGIVTLVMACAFAGAWIRSLVVEDHLVIWLGRADPYGISVSPHRMQIYRMIPMGSKLAIMDDDFELTIYYWHFAIPLTLLSACLILWKPQQRD